MSAPLGTWLRTIRQLHPLQVAARLPQQVTRRIVAVSGVPTTAPPPLRTHRLPAAQHTALAAFAAQEARRYERRRQWLSANPHLQAFESRYALELPENVPANAWTDAVSSAPYVASVRARRLASAIARGRSDLLPHLTRAARAVMIAPEFHLLGNHLLENALGLVCAASVTSGPESDLWWALGARILRWQLPRQFLDDGMHDEGSLSYHLWLVAGLLEATMLARSAGRAVPAAWERLLEQAIGIAVDYQAPDGGYPLFNDAAYDAGPSIAEVRSLAAAAGVTLRGQLLGPCFSSDIGWVVLRNARAWCALKAGPDGSRTQPGHVHADLLAIELWVDGRKTIHDPGVTSYNDDEARRWCRGNAAHNGPHLDGENLPEVWGAFRTGKRCRAKLVDLGVGEDGVVTAVADRPSAAGVFRRTLRLERDGLEVCDQLLGSDAPAARWHAPIHRQVSAETGVGLAEIQRPNARCARIAFP